MALKPEFVVVGKQMSRTDDRVLLFPNKSQKKHASNGYDLIYNLNLPKVNVDLLTNAITTIGGTVTLCINGREVTHNETVARGRTTALILTFGFGHVLLYAPFSLSAFCFTLVQQSFREV